MALFARNLARCAGTALARQLEVCARLKPSYQGVPAKPLVPARGVNGSSHSEAGEAAGRDVPTKGKGAKERKAITSSHTEKIRTKLATPASVPTHMIFLAENTRGVASKPTRGAPARGGRKSISEAERAPLLAELIDSQVGPYTRRNKISTNPLADEATKQGHNAAANSSGAKQNHCLQFHRKEAANIKTAEKQRAGKFQKKRTTKAKRDSNTHTALTEPMSKLARDINQWFNEVMEHLAKAENTGTSASASSCAKKQLPSSTRQQQQQRPKKSLSKRIENVNAHGKEANSTFRNIDDAAKIPATSVQNKTFKSEPSTSRSKPKNPGVASHHDTERQPEDRTDRDLDLQLSGLNEEITRHHLRDTRAQTRQHYTQNTPELQSDKMIAGENQSDSTGRVEMKMLEIRPSLVENSEVHGPLASTAGWWPYGAPHDTLPEIQSIHSEGSNSKARDSQLNAPTAGSAAFVASKVVSGSSRHQLVADAAASNSAISGTKLSTSSDKSSLEKGKGFILLNSKEKERERSNRLAGSGGSSNDKGPRTDSGNISKSFVLIDFEQPENATSSVLSTSKNVLLTDNPHLMAANKKGNKGGKELASSKHLSPATRGKQKWETSAPELPNGKTGDKQKKRTRNSSEEKTASFMTASETKAGKGNRATESTRRWAEMVERKLYEIQSAKQAVMAKDIASQQSTVEQVAGKRAAGENMKTRRADVKQTGSGSSSRRDDAPWDIFKRKESSVKKALNNSAHEPNSSSAKMSTMDSKQRPPSRVDTDLEYEKRIGEFINAAEESSKNVQDSTRLRQFFGPLTHEQHILLERIRNARKVTNRSANADSRRSANASNAQETETGITGHHYLQRKVPARPVSVDELKPDGKSPIKKENAKKDLRQTNEPKLVVKPEEMSTTKKLKVQTTKQPPKEPVDITTSATSNDTRIPSSPEVTKASKKRSQSQVKDPALNEYEVWANMLQSRIDKYRALVELHSEGNAEHPPKDSTNTKSATGPHNTRTKPQIDENTRKSESSKTRMTQSTTNPRSNVLKTPARSRSSDKLTNDKTTFSYEPLAFQEEFIKKQQKELNRSQKTKSRAEDLASKTDKELARKQKVEQSTPDSIVTNTAFRNSQTQALLPSAVEKSDVKGEKNNSFLSNDQHTSKGALKGQISNKHTIDELDPFEAWIRSMEEVWESEEKAVPLRKTGDANKHEKTVSEKFAEHQETSRKSASPSKVVAVTETTKADNNRKKYPRFEMEKMHADIAQEVYRDIRATHAVPQPISISPSRQREGASRKAEKESLGDLHTQSDQIYNQIKKAVARPNSCNKGPLGISSVTSAPRSKVLTQAGMGTITSSTTGLVDPARLPKLGNLLSTFDGFIAMDAVPVLDEPAGKPAKSKMVSVKTDSKPANKISKASGDGIAGDDVGLRASLAREREAASVAARRKLIEEYEKSIEKYERGLEMYRSKLRRAKQSMLESEIRQSRSDDNPRRHPDL